MRDRRPAGRTGHRGAAITLALLAPACAELATGAVPLHLAWLVLPLIMPIYGAGVLLLRELVVRVGGGWPSLLLLGLAYELVEDGIGLQALSSPKLYGAADWGPRVLGFNTTYWESQAGFHIVFSVLIPVMLANLIFPQHRHRPYLRRGGVIGTAICAVLGVALVRLGIPPTMDPGYQAPIPILVAVVVAVALLAVLALRVLPGRTPAPHTTGTPAPVVVGLVAAAATVAFLRLLLPSHRPGQSRMPIFGHGPGVLAAMVLAAVIAVGAGWLVYRWSGASAWDYRHQIWLAGGALVAHTGFGAVVMAHATFDRVGLAVLGVLTVPLLALLHLRVARRPGNDAPDRPAERTGA